MQIIQIIQITQITRGLRSNTNNANFNVLHERNVSVAATSSSFSIAKAQVDKYTAREPQYQSPGFTRARWGSSKASRYGSMTSKLRAALKSQIKAQL